LQFGWLRGETKAVRASSTGLRTPSDDGAPPFVGIFSTAITLSLTVADLAGIDAAPMSKPETKAIAVVVKILIVTPFRNSLSLEWFCGFADISMTCAGGDGFRFRPALYVMSAALSSPD
jgi:hypothetical protein